MPLLFTISRDLYFLTDSRYFYFWPNRGTFTLDDLDVFLLLTNSRYAVYNYFWSNRGNFIYDKLERPLTFGKLEGPFTFYKLEGPFTFDQIEGLPYFLPARRISTFDQIAGLLYFWPTPGTSTFDRLEVNLYFTIVVSMRPATVYICIRVRLLCSDRSYFALAPCRVSKADLLYRNRLGHGPYFS